ncbi:MAG: hypothetical protein NVSMB46_03410 [Candidatus Saccharimonadales bacterium]
MPEFNELAEVLVEAPSHMIMGQAALTGLVNVAIGAAFVTAHIGNDIASQLIEYSVVKPSGVAFGAFGLLCLKQFTKDVLASRSYTYK